MPSTTTSHTSESPTSETNLTYISDVSASKQSTYAVSSGQPETKRVSWFGQFWQRNQVVVLSLLSAVCLFVSATFNLALTQRMITHMLVQIPLIFISGACAWTAWRVASSQRTDSLFARVQCVLRPFNAYAVPTLLAASLILGYWMIPKALDDVLLHRSMFVAKFISLFVAGALFSKGWHQANVVIKLFFVGNFCWMAAIVGMLYQEQPMRVCNFYLQNDQDYTGIALVWLAVLLPVVWALSEYKAVKQYWRTISR